MFVIDASVVAKWFIEEKDSAVELACDKQTTIYDASYLAIASELNIKLITADKKLYNSAKSLQCIELISNV